MTNDLNDSWWRAKAGRYSQRLDAWVEGKRRTRMVQQLADASDELLRISKLHDDVIAYDALQALDAHVLSDRCSPTAQRVYERLCY